MRLIVQKGEAPARCKFTGDETRMHYAMCYNPDTSLLRDVTLVWLCPPCAATIAGELMAGEIARRSEIDFNRRKAKELVTVDQDAVQTRQFLARRNRELTETVRHERNRMCRWCGSTLNHAADAKECELGAMTKYGTFGLQKGRGFAHADLHSPHGYGRAWLMFHTGCCAEWMRMRLTGVPGVLAPGRRSEPPSRSEVERRAASVRGTAQRTMEEAV